MIVRLRRGMYAPADLYNASDDAGKHLLHARAALAAQQGQAALTGPSAAALHGFALYQQDLTMVHLLRLDQGCSHHAAKTNHHVVTQDIEDDLGMYGGVVAISPARAVWEVACRSSLEGGVVTADSALHQDPALSEALEEMQERFAYFPGSRRGRLAIKLADPRADRPGESVTRVQFYRNGIPMPELQYHVIDSNGVLVGIADFHWEEHRHLGEFDGKIKYRRLLRPGETASECVIPRRSGKTPCVPTSGECLVSFGLRSCLRGRAARWQIWHRPSTSRTGCTCAVAPSLPADPPLPATQASCRLRDQPG